jgi:release factor glutamine methyltransferase
MSRGVERKGLEDAVLQRAAARSWGEMRARSAVRVTDLLRSGTASLRSGGVPDPERDAEWLLGAALGLDRGRLYLAACDVVSVAKRRCFESWCARRRRREPLQYILGSQPFRMCSLQVDSRVLIPRPETERVVDLCLSVHCTGPMVDLGTGSGAIAISLGLARPGDDVFATDISAPALSLAEENARRAGASRVFFMQGDLFEPLDARMSECSLVACNPPYVASDELETLAPEVRDWEPRVALDGGPDGLDFYRRLAPAAARALSLGAWMVVEIGEGQRPAVEALFAATKAFAESVAIRDLSGIDRGLGFRRKGGGEE